MLQATLFQAALEAVTSPNNLVHRVLEVGTDGDEITPDLYDLRT